MSDLNLLAILENIDKLEGAVSDEFLRNLCKQAAKEITELNALRLRRETQEPVAFMYTNARGLTVIVKTNTLPFEDAIPLYTHPPRREWQELTDEQIHSACLSYRHYFGLLSVVEQDYIRFQAKKWAAALAKARGNK